MLVAEAIHARAWHAIGDDLGLVGDEAEQAKARLGGIVVRLLANGPRSMGDLTTAAIQTFREANPTGVTGR